MLSDPTDGDPLRVTNGLREFFSDSRSSTQLSDPRLVMGGASPSRAAPYFYALAGRLEAWMREQAKPVLLVTSAVSGEGKSFIAWNVAASIANASGHTLLVEADPAEACAVASPVLSVPGASADRVGDAIRTSASSEDRSIRGLSLLPATLALARNSQSLISAQAHKLIEAARAGGPPRYVIIDAPSVLTGPEAILLARVADAVLFVVAANHTPRGAVATALETVKEFTFAGVVVNRFVPTFSSVRTLKRSKSPRQRPNS